MSHNPVTENALLALAAELEMRASPRTLVLCGGGVMWLRYGFRGTDDLDPVSPANDEVLLDAARLVASVAGNQLDKDWLNFDAANVTRLHELLPDGWLERAVAAGRLPPIHPFLFLHGLAKDDLIRSKLLALVASLRREKHAADLKIIASRGEIEEQIPWLSHTLAFGLGKSQYLGSPGETRLKKSIATLLEWTQ